MKADKLKGILKDLYNLYPDLKNHEKELEGLVLKMIESKPEIEFDESFARLLKEKVLSSLDLNKNNNNNFKFNFMNKRIFVAAGSLVALSIVFIAAISFYAPNKNNDSVWNIASLVSNKNKEVAVSDLAPNSFGSLRTLSYVATGDDSVSATNDGRAVVSGPAGDLNKDIRIMGEEDGLLVSMPYYGVSYVYTGEELSLDDLSSLVYKQINNQEEIAKSLAKNLSSFNFPGIDLKTFDNLRVNSLSFSEDKDRGLSINFELKDGNISIYENWEKWLIPEMEACGGDEACYDNYRVKLSDMPSDDVSISLANQFLAKHSVDTNNYGKPQVDRNWLNYYEADNDKINYYFPNQVSVVYPLLIDNQEVRDQSGYLAGISVDINVREKRVSGLHTAMPYKYEASSYDLVRDGARIIALAEDGGYSGSYYGTSEENVPELELDTPKFVYLKMWRQVEQGEEDILVPALMFPVIRKADESYYGTDYIVVPLIEELIEELEKEQETWLPMQGGIEYFIDDPSFDSVPMLSPDETEL